MEFHRSIYGDPLLHCGDRYVNYGIPFMFCGESKQQLTFQIHCFVAKLDTFDLADCDINCDMNCDIQLPK